MSNIYAMKRPEPVNLKDLEESILYLSDIKSHSRQQLSPTDYMHYLPQDLFDCFVHYYFIDPLPIDQILKNNKHELLQAILNLGFNIKHRSNILLLRMAAELDAAECLDVFLRYAPQHLNCRDSFGCTLLHTAALFGSDKSLQVLLNNKATLINIQSYHGDTPLHSAASASLFSSHKIPSLKKHTRCVKLLLENNADTSIKNKLNYMADDISLAPSEQVRKMICEARKKKNPPVSYCIIS